MADEGFADIVAAVTVGDVDGAFRDASMALASGHGGEGGPADNLARCVVDLGDPAVAGQPVRVEGGAAGMVVSKVAVAMPSSKMRRTAGLSPGPT